MIDREKVIKAWRIFRDSNPYEICSGREFRAIREPEYCMGEMIEDTIALLKEQKSIINELQNAYGYLQKQFFEAQDKMLKEQKPTTFKPHCIDKYGKHFICCVERGSCHKEINSTYHYCPYCERSVKWG